MTHKKYTRHQFLLRFAYCGAGFNGVQEQPGQKTVLGALRARIEVAAQQKARALVASARTDRGVSALNNFASFFLSSPVDINAFITEVSEARDDGLLSVVIHEADRKTHARGSAAKTYRYTIKDDVFSSIDKEGLVWHIVPKLSLAAMQFAALDLVGEKDFSSLRGGGCEAGSPIKKVRAITIMRTKRGYIVIEITGDGFLRNMVRNMVGLLVEMGAGVKPCDSVEYILKEKNRQAAGIMAPAHGLMLIDVALKPMGKSMGKLC